MARIWHAHRSDPDHPTEKGDDMATRKPEGERREEERPSREKDEKELLEGIADAPRGEDVRAEDELGGRPGHGGAGAKGPGGKTGGGNR
jgi:hypothetical protein